MDESTRSVVSPPKLAWLAAGLTIVVALMELVATLKGKPPARPAQALLITLFCATLANFVVSKRFRMIVLLIGIVFAIMAIVGFLNR
jgi:hypothetical protein